jgi:hypothetical protein
VALMSSQPVMEISTKTLAAAGKARSSRKDNGRAEICEPIV